MKENGIWTDEEAQYHQHSQNLANFLIGYLPKETGVVDFGCGQGHYVNELNKADFTALGVDGFLLKDALTDAIYVHDLTKPFTLPTKHNVICLETMEHIPYGFHETLMHSIVSNCDKHLIFSCATIGQPGVGHIACRDMDEVIADIEGRGFKIQKELTDKVRSEMEDEVSWLQRNLLIFERI